MGQVFSEKGMEIDPERVESLRKLQSPRDKTELQRIIGSFNYVRKYIPNMADHIKPLCELLKSNVDFKWLPLQQECFKKLKEIITKSPALLPFDPKKKTILQCDASKNEIGCCMFQEHENKVLKLVACASRSMNDHEVNYSQTEKELLSIYYGTQKFHDFIYSFAVDVQSDHKPIISIMKKPICKIGSVRLQRLTLKLLKYTLNVYYVPGKDIHFADMLSRSSLRVKVHDPEMLEMVHSVSKRMPMSIERQSELRSSTSKDETLSKIIDYYFYGWPKESSLTDDCKPYYKLKDSIFVEAGMVFFYDKLIVPNALRNSLMKIMHKGHIATSKTINNARKLFYWPGLNNDITTFIKQCRTCEKYLPRNRKEHMLPHSIPKLRYNKLGSDILEFAAKPYLVVINYFSHWIDLIPLKDKTSNSVINAFEDVFTKFGYPQILIADNLPFISQKCLNYYRGKDITVATCTPEWHQSNSFAEKAVSISKQILRKSLETNTDFRESVMEYNNTEIISLQASAAQILQSRSLRTQLPTICKNLEPQIKNNVYNILCKQQKQIKIHYDKTARRNTIDFKTGDKVVIKSSKDIIWHKAIVMEKAKEPRSYWFRKEHNNKIVRRNSNQMKPSITKSCTDDHVLNPEFYPDLVYKKDQSTCMGTNVTHPQNVIARENTNNDIFSKPSSSRVEHNPSRVDHDSYKPKSVSQRVTSKKPDNLETKPPNVSKSGRVIKIPHKFIKSLRGRCLVLQPYHVAVMCNRLA
ncbi:hypothetical protein PPYR_13218 [Photinus pyralis]|uniref:RNA-directed DNA polymerase n=1 Tax=Photinus pyralis TaxID=7054 RepID=A0A5N4A8L1_PHOPY|nr:hypothetical protein PPYR_13218 [Photinus pyralis]